MHLHHIITQVRPDGSTALVGTADALTAPSSAAVADSRPPWWKRLFLCNDAVVCALVQGMLRRLAARGWPATHAP